MGHVLQYSNKVNYIIYCAPSSSVILCLVPGQEQSPPSRQPFSSPPAICRSPSCVPLVQLYLGKRMQRVCLDRQKFYLFVFFGPGNCNSKVHPSSAVLVSVLSGMAGCGGFGLVAGIGGFFTIASSELVPTALRGGLGTGVSWAWGGLVTGRVGGVGLRRGFVVGGGGLAIAGFGSSFPVLPLFTGFS